MATKKKEKADESDSTRDILATELAAALNKENKAGGKAAFFLSEEDDPSQVVDWISTGNSMLDLAICNRPNGGLPVGRIVELNGLEGSGKSLIGAHVLAETQRKGGVAVFIDTEASVSNEFLQAIGVDLDKLLYISTNSCEDVLEKIESIIEKVRTKSSNRLVTILWDSVAASSTLKELAADHGQDGYATGKAIILSKGFRKITEMIGRQRVLLVCTNQLRQKMGFVGFGDQFTTSGGKALAFHASVRIRLKSTGQIKLGDEVIGTKTKAVVVKNRLGPPYRSAEFNIFYDRGVDNYGNWLELLMEHDVITNAKAEKVAPDGKKKSKKELDEEKEAKKKAKSLQFEMGEEVIKFEKKDFISLLRTRSEVKEFLYNTLCEKAIMKYRDPSDGFDEDIEITDAAEGGDE